MPSSVSVVDTAAANRKIYWWKNTGGAHDRVCINAHASDFKAITPLADGHTVSNAPDLF